MTRFALCLTLLLCAGCVSREELNRAMDDQTRFAGRVMGFALDSHQETLRTHVALLRAFDGDPKQALLEQHLGSIADVEAKLERVRAEKRSLVEENQRLRARYAVEGGGE